MTDTATSCRCIRMLLALLVTITAIFTGGRPVSAHTDFSFSEPADGTVVEGPVTEILIGFTNPAEPAGDGFRLLDPTGNVLVPTTIDSPDGTSFVLGFDPPLTAGTYGVRWSVRAGDAHPVEGSFRFEVTGPTATSEPVIDTTTVPGAIAPATTTPTTTSATPVADDMPDMDMADMDMADHSSMTEDETLDAFLDVSRTGADAVDAGLAGRVATMLGAIFGIGMLTALAWTIRGRREELTAHLARIRIAGLAILTGGIVEYLSLADADPAISLGSLTSTKAGLAVLLNVAGGFAVLIGFHRRCGKFTPPTRTPSAPVGNGPYLADHHDAYRWTPTSSAAFGLAGYGAVLVSFCFDGHTVSEGPWIVHALADLVHLGAAAVWGGGVFAITITAWSRRHRSEGTGIAAMIVRFSTVATVALVAVVAAGALMAWMILDTPGDLVGTPWGRLLIAKTSLVGVVAAIGGYNHVRLRPALERHPDDPDLARRLRTAVSIESAVFVVVVVVTAFLVAASAN